MIRSFIITLIVVFSAFIAPARSQTEAEIEAIYQERIKQEMINGVYIPVDLEDAHQELERLADPAGLASFKKAPEADVARKLHFGLGRWIMVNWGIDQGSRVSHYFRQKGISVPDDIVRVIIVTWHRKLNGHPQKLDEEIAVIKKKMEEEKARRDADKKITVIEKRPHKE